MELKQVLESGDLETIREKTQALNEAAQPLAQALYADAQAASAQGSDDSGAATNGAAGEDEVVEDADFEVIEDDETATKA
jgi:molecular chaperone DnaK